VALLAKLNDMGEVHALLLAKRTDAIKPTASTGKTVSSSHGEEFTYLRHQETAT
jgi:hypothetical protein